MRSTWDRVVELDPTDCMKLLSSVRFGRIAWTGADGPQVLPVNHTVLDGQIIIRTALYSTTADATRNNRVAFKPTSSTTVWRRDGASRSGRLRARRGPRRDDAAVPSYRRTMGP